MKNIISPAALTLLIALTQIPMQVNASNIYALGVGLTVDANSALPNPATNYFDLLGNTHSNPLSASLGTINKNDGGVLLLAGATAKTWQSSGQTSDAVLLFYRIYQQGASTLPGFTSYGITYGNEWVENGDTNKYWSSTSAPGTVDLLSSLNAGTTAAPITYTLEFYGEAKYLASPNFSMYASNGGSNYTTSFQLVPEPSSASLMALGTAGLLALRRRRNA